MGILDDLVCGCIGMVFPQRKMVHDCGKAAGMVPGIERQDLTSEDEAKLLKSAPAKIVAGFDGLVACVVEAVDERTSVDKYTTIPTLAAFGQRILGVGSESGATNVEFVTKMKKLGGAGPNICEGLLGYEAEVTYIGPIGKDKPDEVFEALAGKLTEAITLGPPATTDALEFKDGNLMMGKLQALEVVTYENIVAAVGAEKWITLCAECDAIVSVNWTMVMTMTNIWQGMIDNVLPQVAEQKRRPYFFVDLCDPKKRTAEDLKLCLDTLTAVEAFANVVLALNGSEARQCLEVFGETWDGSNEAEESARVAAIKLQSKMKIHMVQIHLQSCAAGAMEKESVAVPGFYTLTPVITMGGGDHFNAGFLAALVTGCSLGDCLRIGGATSGNYVRGVSSRGEVKMGLSPTAQDTVDFLTNLPEIDEYPGPPEEVKPGDKKEGDAKEGGDKKADGDDKAGDKKDDAAPAAAPPA